MQIYTEKGMKPSDAITFLKKNPERIADFPLPSDVTQEVLHDSGIIVLDSSPLMDETLVLSKKYGLLFSYALHAASCTHYALDHLITNDRDFSRVDGISVIAL